MELIEWFNNSIGGEFLMTMLVSMLPVIELRGGIPFGAAMGLSVPFAAVASVIGNMLPIPFELLFIRKIFEWLKKFAPFRKVIVWLEERAERKGKEIETYKMLGLFLLVAIPLPGTGAWTGGLVADLLKMRIKHSIPIITLGVIAAGIIVSILSYGTVALF